MNKILMPLDLWIATSNQFHYVLWINLVIYKFLIYLLINKTYIKF